METEARAVRPKPGVLIAVAVVAATLAAVAAVATPIGKHKTSAPLTSGQPGSVQVSGHASIERVPDHERLLSSATLVVVARVDAGHEVVPTGAGDGAYYEHEVHIQEVLRGAVGGKTVRVLRAGLLPGSPAARGLAEDEMAGALRPGVSVLFLQPSGKPGVYQIVGHTQGELPVSGNRVTRGRGPSAIDHFDGMTLEEFRKSLRG